MSDILISRQEAYDGILQFMPAKVREDATVEEQVNYVAWNCALACAASFVRTMPSAQPEVISCLDCIHYTPLGIDKSWGRCAIHSSPTENQRMCQSCDFCAWAERKADE